MINCSDPQSPEIEDSLTDIEQAASRGGEIAMELLLFSRGRPAAASGVAETTKTLHTSLRFMKAIAVGPGIQVVSSVADDLPPVAVTARPLEQSLLNMALNARAAITSEHGSSSQPERPAPPGRCRPLAAIRVVLISRPMIPRALPFQPEPSPSSS